MTPQYYIMTEEGQQGPFPLEELPAHGVRPSTYVWTKGMPDWQQASEVADICRLYRRHLAGVATGSDNAPVADRYDNPETLNQDAEPTEMKVPVFARGFSPVEDKPNLDSTPYYSLFLSVLSILLCFPPTGFIALYFCYRTKLAWSKAQDPALSPEDSQHYKAVAHDSSRLFRMWLGITASLGFVLLAIVTALF